MSAAVQKAQRRGARVQEVITLLLGSECMNVAVKHPADIATMLSSAPELAHKALEAAPYAMIIIDGGGTIHYSNRQVFALFGYPHEEITGLSIEHLLPERFRSRHIGHRERYTNNIRVRPMGAGLQLYGQRKDGSEFPVEISLSPIEDGDQVLVAAAIRDVTDGKRVQAELIAAREAAEQAREVAYRANQGKSRFLATASHDLRQPLQTFTDQSHSTPHRERPRRD